ncbi:glucosyltransferase domain-containing protein [Photobacterium angustum]|uniref:Glycosyltransferase RgtA/B/C/D-like domain-containing protein n=1 Tax=Photobacterium angustum TaxID=661 RepID=A0A2S7VVY2_PHOAN|nr:glucosyltransferase domain-containing protein [Photobacterium angustum]PQJ66277.1 hypothetical protein BTO08_02010 [Photobacterium angustum]
MFFKEFNQKVFLKLLIISFSFYFPVIFAGAFYADDINRINVNWSGFGWDPMGRPLATIIAEIYSNSQKLIVDAAPLTWVLSIILIGFSSYLIYYKLKDNYKDFALPLSVVFIVNPFFIGNLLYRFDSLGMFLALTFSVLAFSLKEEKFNYIIKIILLTFALNFYQPFSNLYISLLSVFILLMAYKKEKFSFIISYLIKSIVIFILANVFYMIEMKILSFPSRGGILPLDISSIEVIINNITNGFKPFLSFWSYFENFFYPVVIISVILSFIFIRNVKLYLYLCLSIIVFLISILGGMAILKEQIYDPRVLPYFSVVLMLLTCIFIMSRVEFKWLISIPIFACFIFSYRIGNIQKLQHEYERPIAFNLSLDVASLGEVSEFYSIGQIPNSHFIRNLMNNTPFNGFLRRADWITTGIVNEYVPRGLIAFQWSSAAKETKQNFYSMKEEMTLSIDRKPYYQIYKKGNKGWILWL